MNKDDNVSLFTATSTIIRIILSVGMSVMVGKEAGPWTGTSIFLIFLGIEGLSYGLKSLTQTIKGVIDNMGRLINVSKRP